MTRLLRSHGGIFIVLAMLSFAQAATVPEKPLELYLLIGQSNMAGRGIVEPQDQVVHPRVFTFNTNNAWVPATDPLHSDRPTAGVGLGSAFGRLMAERDPAVRIGLIPCAVGGTPIIRWQKGADLYEAAVQRARLAAKDGRIVGVLWHQGEADSGQETTAAIYARQLDTMIRDLRADLSLPNLPVVVGQLGAFYTSDPFQGTVNAALKDTPKRVPRTAWVSTEGLKDKGDKTHFDSAGYRELGRRYFQAMVPLLPAESVPAK